MRLPPNSRIVTIDAGKRLLKKNDLVKVSAAPTVLAAACLVAAIGVLPAMAATPPPAGSDNARNLGTITITGDKLRVLQEIKAALKRQFSYAAADRNKLVCRVQTETGSRLRKALVCGTNYAWYKRAERYEINWGAILRGGTLANIKAVNMAFQIPLVSASDFKHFIESVPGTKPWIDPNAERPHKR